MERYRHKWRDTDTNGEIQTQMERYRHEWRDTDTNGEIPDEYGLTASEKM